MSVSYVMDACALVAFLQGEMGAEAVTGLLRDAEANRIPIYMNRINLLEVYYDKYRVDGKQKADAQLNMIHKLPLTIVREISDAVFFEAGRLKASRRISLADSIALAEAFVRNAVLVTADHHEFDVIEQSGEIKFHWIR